MDTVYPPAASALARGRRRRCPESRMRHRTMPVTFAEIKEVDEDNLDSEKQSAASVTSIASAVEERRRRPDLLAERLGRQFAEFRRRRPKREQLREPDEHSQPLDKAESSRADSEPRALEPS